MAAQVPRALWRRLPTYFPNIELTMYRPAKEEWKKAQELGYLERAVFRTTPQVTKLELREFLEKVYNLPVLSVHTAIVAGKLQQRVSDKRRMRKPIAMKNSDYKKAWVHFGPGTVQPEPRQQTHAEAMDTLRADFAAAAEAKIEARRKILAERDVQQQQQQQQQQQPPPATH